MHMPAGTNTRSSLQNPLCLLPVPCILLLYLQIRGILEEMGQLTGMMGSIEYSLAEDR